MNPCFETHCQFTALTKISNRILPITPFKLNKLSHCSFKLFMSKATNNEIEVVRYNQTPSHCDDTSKSTRSKIFQNCIDLCETNGGGRET